MKRSTLYLEDAINMLTPLEEDEDKEPSPPVLRIVGGTEVQP